MGRMTKDERATRDYLAEKLAEQGYVTYSELFQLFDLRLLYSPDFIGYMEPGLGRITLNGTLDEHTLCLVIRHEILHEYLTHEMRAISHVAKKMGLSEDEVDDLTIRDIKNIIYKKNRNFNIAGDYEISNRGYTEQDKKDIRNIKLGGQIVSGLVTELDHPDWIDLPLEDMYDLLEDEWEQNKPESPDSPEPPDSPEDGDSQPPQSGQSPQQGQSQEQGQSPEPPESPEGGNPQSPESPESPESSGDEESGKSSNGPEGPEGPIKAKGGDTEDAGDDYDDGDFDDDDYDSFGDDDDDGDGGNETDNDSKKPPKGSKGQKQNGDYIGGKVIHGTFSNGKFYGPDGKEIIPGR